MFCGTKLKKNGDGQNFESVSFLENNPGSSGEFMGKFNRGVNRLKNMSISLVVLRLINMESVC